MNVTIDHLGEIREPAARFGRVCAVDGAGGWQFNLGVTLACCKRRLYGAELTVCAACKGRLRAGDALALADLVHWHLPDPPPSDFLRNPYAIDWWRAAHADLEQVRRRVTSPATLDIAGGLAVIEVEPVCIKIIACPDGKQPVGLPARASAEGR